MENRERDRVSQRTEPTEAGELNRKTSEDIGRSTNTGTTAEFGQSIGRAENLREGGEMRDRNDDMSNRGVDRSSDNEPSRRSGSEGYGSSTGRSGSVGSMGGGGSDISRDESSRDRDKSSTWDSDRSRGDSSEGRH